MKKILEKRLVKVFENEHELIDIYFTKSEYASVRHIHSREFVYRGEYFDIKAKIERNDTVFLKVHPDKREKSIFSHLKNIVEKSDEGSQKKQTSAFFKMFDAFDIASYFNYPESTISSISKKNTALVKALVSQHNLRPQCPPPDNKG